MSRLKFKEIAAKSDKELQTMIDDNRKKLAQARIDMRTKQVKNVKEIHSLKLSLAQALTAQRQKLDAKEENNG